VAKRSGETWNVLDLKNMDFNDISHIYFKCFILNQLQYVQMRVWLVPQDGSADPIIRQLVFGMREIVFVYI
jgi:hypothetical protein